MNKPTRVASPVCWVILMLRIPAFAADPKNCGLPRYASLDLVVVGNTTLLVPVTIQDTRAYMALSLANPFSSLTEKAVGDLALRTMPIPASVTVHAGRNQVQRAAQARPFALGRMKFTSVDFLVFPKFDFPPNLADAPVVGVLGMDVFKNADIELDIAHKKLNIYSQDHCPGKVVYWTDKYDSAPIRFGQLGEFYFPMELDGKKLETTLATGDSTTTLRTDVTRKLYNFDSHSEDIETEIDRAGNTIGHYRAMKLSGEGIDIINARISLVDPPTSGCFVSSRQGAAAYDGCMGVHPLALGRNVLSKLHIYIATKEKMLYFTPAAPAEEKPQ